MSDHFSMNKTVLFLKSLGKEALSKGYIHLFVNLHMRLFLLQKCLTNVVCGPNHSAFFIYTIVAPISWLKIYLENLTISTSIIVDFGLSNSNIKYNHCTVQSQTTPRLIGSLSVFKRVKRLSYSTKTYISEFPTHVYRDLRDSDLGYQPTHIGIL